MSDIIEHMEAWIRPAGTNVDLPFYREAIDEIKLLRALLAEALDPTGYVLTRSWCERARRALGEREERMSDRPELRGIIARLDAEIERLRAVADAAAELIVEAERTQIGFVALSKLRAALENARKE